MMILIGILAAMFLLPMLTTALSRGGKRTPAK